MRVAVGCVFVLAAASARAAELGGSVQGPGFAPVVGALVAAVAPNANAPAAVVRTSEGGAFRFAGLAAGRYGVTVTARGLQGAYRGGLELRDGAETAPLTITLEKATWTLRGYAAADDEKAQPGARVLAARFSDEDADLFPVEVGPDGRFEVGLPSASYAVTASLDGYETGRANVAAGDTKPVVLRLFSLAELRAPAPADVVAEVKRAAIPLATVEAGHGFADMTPLAKVVGDARIVALGEATHGTREFFQLKHRMLEDLVSELGFTVFAIEAAQPEARAVDAYVTTGAGDPAKALSGLYFWTWDTEEVLAMIRWMRRWNEDPRHARKVRFAGVDMQSPRVAEASVRDFLRPIDAAWAASLDASLAPFREWSLRADWPKKDPSKKVALVKSVAALNETLDERRDELVARGTRPAYDVARHDARILAQFVELLETSDSGLVRDRAMAENAAWILEQAGPGARMAVWAHNGHISRNPESLGDPMGAHLSRRFGRNYVSFGFAFSEGGFQAVEGDRLRDFAVGPAPAGSVDGMLAATGLPLFALDLRALAPTSAAGMWLAKPRKARTIGASYREADAESFYLREKIGASYDALLFVAKTSPARPNPGSARQK